MNTETIDKATSGGDLLTWGIMFGLLIIATIGLAIWDKKNRKD
ncbi:hypothetical protein MNBD_BACTEROID06-1811 [hydrothermal vent metagenome]|uniref:Uncharacterized protein n=1 Tax=hydrothermal vent metagenome TaxID=652676 RepID=A0A3B0U8G7_9ZZZZ